MPWALFPLSFKCQKAPWASSHPQKREAHSVCLFQTPFQEEAQALKTKLLSVAAILVTTSAVAFAPVASAHSGSSEFKDMGEASWAQSAVAQLAFQGIVQGTGNGNFTPNGSVTRDEAIAMLVRALSGGQTQGTTLHFSDHAKVPGWAMGAIEEAIAMGILQNSGTLNPSGNATRAQVIAWLISAMGLQNQAQNQSTTVLTSFQDNSQIPTGDLHDCALAVSLGLLKGEGNGHLNPEGTITRAELAALIARLQAQFGTPNTQTNVSLVTGTLTSVSTTAPTTGTGQGTITLTLQDGTTQTINVNADATIFNASATATLATLPTAGPVVVGLDSTGNAAFIETLTAPTQATEAEGTVTAITGTAITITPSGHGSGGHDHNGWRLHGQQPQTPQTYTLDANVVVAFHGQSVPLTDVGVGSRVNLQIDTQGGVSAITLQTMSETVTGTITVVDGNKIVMQDAAGTLVLIRVDGPNVQLQDATGIALDPSVLVAGAQIQVTGIFGEEGLMAQTVVLVQAAPPTPLPTTP